MNGLKKKLKGWGADPDAALHRMLGDEDFYLKLLREFACEQEVSDFELAVEARNYKEAFRLAHSMKGTAANLSLTPLYDALSVLVEDLRGGPVVDLLPDLQNYWKEKEAFQTFLENAS